jgi:hypothetical protein
MAAVAAVIAHSNRRPAVKARRKQPSPVKVVRPSRKARAMVRRRIAALLRALHRPIAPAVAAGKIAVSESIAQKGIRIDRRRQS